MATTTPTNPDTRKLDWVYDYTSSEYRAQVSDTIRVRAVLDSDAQNPLTNDDGHWPMVVRDPDARGSFTAYESNATHSVLSPLDRVADAELVHLRFNLAKIMGFAKPTDLLECHGLSTDTDPANADALREALVSAIDDCGDSEVIARCAKIYDLIGIPCWSGTLTGHAQRDWCEALVVGAPETVEKFGCTAPPTPDDLKSTADTYAAWAYGDVYGYVIEVLVDPTQPDDDEDTDPEWTETDSCWGYYGSDFEKSGLSDAALEALPDDA